MTYDEFLAWSQYVRTRGTLNDGMRMEWLFARLSLQVNHAAGGKAEFQDLIRYHEEPAADLDAVAKLMGVKQVKNNG